MAMILPEFIQLSRASAPWPGRGQAVSFIHPFSALRHVGSQGG